ncbi:MAG: DUF1349 domain-containing protein [Planctomycetota bacterium]
MADKKFLKTKMTISDKTESYRKALLIPLHGGITQKQKSIKSLILPTVVLTLLASFYASAETVITIRPYEHKHIFYITGATHDWYRDHLLFGTSYALRERAYDWLFKDLSHEYYRFAFWAGEGESTNDNDDPNTINWDAMTFPGHDGNATLLREALERNPNTKIMAYACQVPKFLEDPNGYEDYSEPNLWAELAENIFANLINMKKNEGIQVDMIDIKNEPDWPVDIKHIVEDRIINIIPILRALIDGPQNDCGLLMPKVVAPSTLSTSAAKWWIEDWYNNNPACWNNIDVVSCHPYHAGFDYNNYAAIAAVKGGRLFVQNEMEFGHGSFVNNGDNILPEDFVEDPIESALSLGRVFAMAVNAGANGFMVFHGNSPDGSTPDDNQNSLIHTPWNGTPTRRKGYYAYKQLTTLQTYKSDVVEKQIADGWDGLHVIAYHKLPEKKTVVTVVNAKNTTQQITLRLLNYRNEEIPITRLLDNETSAVKNCTLNSDTLFDPPENNHVTLISNHTLRTFEIYFGSQAEILYSDDDFESAGFSGGSNWDGNFSLAGSDEPSLEFYNKNYTAELRWNASIERTLVTGVDKGFLRFLWDVDSLDNANETATAEVFDGTWHTVFSVDYSANGPDSFEGPNNIPDNLQQAGIDLSPYGRVTKIRFKIDANDTSDFFFIDNVMVLSDTVSRLDFTGDGNVNFKDLSRFAQYYSQYEPSIDVAPLPSGDGIVDAKELAALAAAWLLEQPPWQPGNDGPDVPPAPWISADIGNPTPGNVDYNPSTQSIDITGNGDDIWNDADNFHYVYQEWTGDIEIIGRVASFPDGPDCWQKAGAMVRDDLTDGSIHILMAILGTCGNGASFQGRDAPYSDCWFEPETTVVTEPEWFRLVRTGNTFSGYRSEDGVNWIQVGTDHTTFMTDPVYIGLAVTSHFVDYLVTATIDNLGGDVYFRTSIASEPNPLDLAVDVPIDANLAWTRGVGAMWDYVYFGTDPCDMNLPQVATLQVGVDDPLYDPPGDLIAGTTYYWYITEVNSPNEYPGPLWSFSTIPGEATPLDPLDGDEIDGEPYPDPPAPQTHIWTMLIFNPGPTAVEHTGYFSDDYSKVYTRHPDANLGPPPYSYPGWEYIYFAGNPEVAPATDTLVRGTTYYWTVDETDALGNVFPGGIWEFNIQGPSD